MGPQPGGIWTAVVPLLFIVMTLLRGSRARNLKIEQLWIMPVVILALIGLALSQQGVPSAVGIVVDVVALALGAALGWWRGRFTNITIAPETHALTSKASPVGLILIAGVFAIRYFVRGYATAHAGELHASVAEITDAFLVLAVGLVCAQRLEIWLRASRMLTEARAAKA